MNTHVLRATCITKVFESGHEEEEIATKKVIDPRSALQYMKTEGNVVQIMPPIRVMIAKFFTLHFCGFKDRSQQRLSHFT